MHRLRCDFGRSPESMGSSNNVIFILWIFAAAIGIANGAKLVILPMGAPSHVSQATNIGETLIQNGHEVHMILPSSLPHLDKHRNKRIKILVSQSVEKDIHSNTPDMKMVLDMVGKPPVMSEAIPGLRSLCTNVLADVNIMKELRSIKPDLFLVDSIPFWHCAYIIPYRLGIPYVSYGSAISQYWARTPDLPSATPFGYGKPFTNRMTFFERLENTLAVLSIAFFPVPIYNREDWCGKYAPDKPNLSLNELVGKSLLWFKHTDFVLDYPAPAMPNYVYIGGITTGPAKPLPPEFDNILNSAEHGVIIVSFGSMLPDLFSDRFMKVFSRLPQTIVWRHFSEYEGETPVPKNVHLFKWLPQNDILGHNNTRLFITHGGANGQFEAVYHGVPMISFPTFAEQPYNAKRMAYHGYGRVLNIKTFTEYELFEAITDILKNSSYADNIQLASRIYRSQMRPKEKIVYWVNHILEFGADHLIPYGVKMPWYSYWMLDIIGFVMLTTTLSFCMCIFCIRTFCCKVKKSPKSKYE